MVSLDGQWGWALTLLFGQTHWCVLSGASSARLGFFCWGITPADLGYVGLKANPDLQTTEPGSEGWQLKLLSPVYLRQLQHSGIRSLCVVPPELGLGQRHISGSAEPRQPVSVPLSPGLSNVQSYADAPQPPQLHVPGSTRAC